MSTATCKMGMINLYVIVVCLLSLNKIYIICYQNDETPENIEEVTTVKSVSTEEQQQTIFEIPDDKWVSNALQDIAYYLRNYKFNEWDRRYYNERPDEELIGYYDYFPTPSLRSLNWKVYENCYENFYKCIMYIHSIVEMAPLTRGDDTSTIINENVIPLNETLVKNLDNECKVAISNTEKSGLPFDGPIEKFQWRTSASYYMCWYTMLETPAMAMLGEACDNFANCLDPKFGHQNKDPRADDRVSFACATYSFCPDPCCPLKHIPSYSQCYNNELNPCFAENSKNEPKERTCKMNRKNNQNFRDIVTNNWNVSCHCNENKFTWKSEFGICVDINECVTGEHDCDRETQDCLNLPGTFKCVCRWGYSLDKDKKHCTEKKIFKEPIINLTEHYNTIRNLIRRLLKYFGF